MALALGVLLVASLVAVVVVLVRLIQLTVLIRHRATLPPEKFLNCAGIELEHVVLPRPSLRRHHLKIGEYILIPQPFPHARQFFNILLTDD